jgi:hypothetical protein
MDAPPVAESLPESYRLVLDRVAELEAAGHRREADLLRRDAIAAYSRRWDDRAAQRLERLTGRAERVLTGRDRPRGRRTERGAPGSGSFSRLRLGRHQRPGGLSPDRPPA